MPIGLIVIRLSTRSAEPGLSSSDGTQSECTELAADEGGIPPLLGANQGAEPVGDFADRGPAEGRVDQVIEGGGDVLAEELPGGTASSDERKRSPETIAAGSGRVVIEAPLIRVRELIVQEAIVVPDESIPEISSPALGAHIGPRPALDVPVVGPGYPVNKGDTGGGVPETSSARSGEIGPLLSL